MFMWAMESQLEKQIYLSENKKAERSKVIKWKFWEKCRLKKFQFLDGIWTHDPPWSSQMLHQWATGDSMVNKGQINTCCCYFSISRTNVEKIKEKKSQKTGFNWSKQKH